jgi:hypothetical protein
VAAARTAKERKMSRSKSDLLFGRTGTLETV